MTKHLFGEWVLGPHPGDGSGAEWRTVLSNGGPFSPAFVCSAMLDDALLIADAPAMLEALEIAFNALRSSAGPEERMNATDTLRALIAKHMEPNQ